MKTMEIRQKHQRKLMNTREGLEMIKTGLVKLHNIPITEPREVRQLRNFKRTTIEFLDRLEGPKKPKLTEEHGGLMEIMYEPFERLSNNTEESVRKTMVNLNINENFIATRWKNQMIGRYVTRTEIILYAREIRTISAEEIMDHG